MRRRCFRFSTAAVITLLLLPLLIQDGFVDASSPTSPGGDHSNHSSRRSSNAMQAMTAWAKEQNIWMHENLQWVRYDSEDDDSDGSGGNWGLELNGPVERGTTILRVPRHIVLDSDSIRKEFSSSACDGPDKLQKAFDVLREQGCEVHQAGFLIFLKLLRISRCSRSREEKDKNSKWLPYVQGLPKTFVEFTKAERECLPYYAKYAADYQDKKFDAFCKAADVLGERKEEGKEEEEEAINQLKWAFNAVGSRFWKNRYGQSELVPIGDMFNHRDPPNVDFEHDPDDDNCVQFIYLGDDDDGTIDENDDDNNNNNNNKVKDLYISYGQPTNPHRFLVIFGFVPQPNDMPRVWSHIAYPNNPFSDKFDKMSFGTDDGKISKTVWDAILHALLADPEPATTTSPPPMPPVYTQERHDKAKKYTFDVLSTHVKRQLEELTMLKPKIDTLEAIRATTTTNVSSNNNNIALIRQHNEFLTSVFSKVMERLQRDGVVIEPDDGDDKDNNGGSNKDGNN